MTENKTPIRIIRGDTTHLNINVLDANGNPWTLAAGEKLVFGVKDNTNSTVYCVKKYVDEGTAPFEVVLRPTDTQSLRRGTYYYDVGIQTGEDYYHILPISPFTVNDSVTEWGC